MSQHVTVSTRLEGLKKQTLGTVALTVLCTNIHSQIDSRGITGAKTMSALILNYTGFGRVLPFLLTTHPVRFMFWRIQRAKQYMKTFILLSC